jgi:hypothetical protein
MKTKYKRRHDEFDGRRSFIEEWKLHRDLNKASKNPPYTTSLKINEKDLGSSAPTAEKNRTTLAQSLAGIKSMADFEKMRYTLIQERDYGNGKTDKVTLDKVLDNKKIAEFMRQHPGGSAELYFRTLDKKNLPMTIAKSGKPDRAGPLDDFAKSGFGKEITKAALDHIRMTMEKFKELEAKKELVATAQPKPPQRQPPPVGFEQHQKEVQQRQQQLNEQHKKIQMERQQTLEQQAKNEKLQLLQQKQLESIEKQREVNEMLAQMGPDSVSLPDSPVVTESKTQHEHQHQL